MHYNSIPVCVVLLWDCCIADIAITLPHTTPQPHYSCSKTRESHQVLGEMPGRPFHGLAEKWLNWTPKWPVSRFVWIVLDTYCSHRLPKHGYRLSPCAQLTVEHWMGRLRAACLRSVYPQFSLPWRHARDKLSQSLSCFFCTVSDEKLEWGFEAHELEIVQRLYCTPLPASADQKCNCSGGTEGLYLCGGLQAAACETGYWGHWKPAHW